MFSRCLLLCLLALPVLADGWRSQYGLEKQWEQREVRTVLYDASGQQYVEKRGVWREPIEVVDTVRFAGQQKQLALNARAYRHKANVSATSSDKFRVLSIIGRTKAVTIDSTALNRTGDTLTIYSTDTGLVDVKLMVQ